MPQTAVHDLVLEHFSSPLPAGKNAKKALLLFMDAVSYTHLDVYKRQAVKAAKGRVPVIAGAGSNSTAHALLLTKAAEKAGADALLHVTPYYLSLIHI